MLLNFRHPAGGMPSRRSPAVLLSTQLTEVRGFSDFFSEFFQVLPFPFILTIAGVSMRCHITACKDINRSDVNYCSTFMCQSIVQGLEKSALPRNLKMVVLGNRPNFEFKAFQVGTSCISRVTSWQHLSILATSAAQPLQTLSSEDEHSQNHGPVGIE